MGVLREWMAHQRTFDLIGADYSRTREIADGSGGFVRYRVSTVTPSAFGIAGVEAMLGRTLTALDEAPGAEPVVVLGHRIWKTRFGSDPGVIGGLLELDAAPHRIVGVMPEGFRFPISEDLWVPLRIGPAGALEAQPLWMRVFGRLAPGVTMAQAQAELEGIRAGYAAMHPEDVDLRDRRATVIPYVQLESGDGENTLFFGMFAFVLLVVAIACASVANLLLCRSMARQNELAVRAAMGASRRRLVSQLFVEALVITSVAAFVGVGSAGLGLRWFNAYIAIENLPFWVRFGISPAAAVFTVATAFVAALLAGVFPAIRATSASVLDVLQDEQRGASGVRFGMVSGALTVAEVTIAVACLAAAGLAARSLLDANGAKGQLHGERILIADVRLTDQLRVNPDGSLIASSGSIPPDRWPNVAEEIRAAVAALPGVHGVALATRLPMQQHVGERMEIDGTATGEPATGVRVLETAVTPELFETFGARVLAGRLITRDDTAASGRVAVVNRSLATRFFGNENPVGRRIRRVDPELRQSWMTIVGIVDDLPMNPASESQPGYYTAFAQHEASTFSLAATVDVAPSSLAAATKAAVKRIDERIEIAEVQTHMAMAEGMLVSYKLMSVIFVALGGAALFLSVAGLYAVMSFSVTQRTREIGVRLALGATASGVTAVVLQRGLRQIAAGVALGSAAGWALMRVLSLIPIGMSPAGPSLLVMAAGVMLLAGAGACLAPMLRTWRIQPIEALRHN